MSAINNLTNRETDEDALPRNHGHTEAHESAYTETGQRTDDDFYDAGERETDTRVYSVHAAHRSPEVYDEEHICGVREHREHDSPAARGKILLVLRAS